ncbi:MAG TPA: NAD(P)/FAD-dependent oxidoreductase [Rhizomicrobium sp.]|jgi:flavin-dependent dehydrogenase|nr:NAD(P)/FAD-dependent oxidoreductase [Rhizomicrobium sp.]
MIYDVIVVGAGAGGASAASLLAREGISTLLLDKGAVPRDTVRSDGLMPQAVYWLDRLGCADAVLAEAGGCIKACDLYVDGRHLLTGRFPAHTSYPDFALLVLRRRFNEILRHYATAGGARYVDKTLVRGLAREKDHVRVLAQTDGKTAEYRGRIVIGADGASSAVSRAIGNGLKDGVLGLSVRTTYANVACDAGIRVYFNREYFPSYGWVFIDEHNTACVGLGCAVDRKFPVADNLGPGLRQFIDADLTELLAGATRIGPFSGGIAGHYRPDTLTADGVILIGDAANQADPLNRGGIHTAIESAFCAVDACKHALSAGDFSRATLSRYEDLWSAQCEPDWRTSEIFMSIAKNPALKDLALFLLKQVGTLTAADPQFGAFVSGVFSGVVSQNSWLTPRALLDAFPKDPATWKALLRDNSRSNRSAVAGSLRLAGGALTSAARSGLGLARHPGATLGWGVEVATQAFRLANRQLGTTRAAAPTGN